MKQTPLLFVIIGISLFSCKMNAQQNAQQKAKALKEQKVMNDIQEYDRDKPLDDQIFKLNSQMGSNSEMELSVTQLIGLDADNMDANKGKPIYEHYAKDMKKQQAELEDLRRENSILLEKIDSLLLEKDKLDTTKSIK